MSRKSRVDDEGRIYLGEKLRKFREEFLHMNQEEMAGFLIGVSQRDISNWETGKKNLTPGDIGNIYLAFKDYKRFEETNIVGEYKDLQARYWDNMALGTA